MKEFELIKRLTHGIPVETGKLVYGIGDDCAVIESGNGKSTLVTTDSLYEGVHFRLDWISPQELGRKTLAVNISDIAAMGGKPLYYLVSVGIPSGFHQKDVEAVFAGMAQIASSYKMILIGGDTCKSQSGLLLTITAIGEIESERVLYRSGAEIGDALYVTGTLGDSYLGLVCLEKGMKGLEERQFIKRHNEPTPRVAVGQWLAASGCVSSMIDISDGLAGDLSHIAEMSSCRIKINCRDLPFAKGFAEMSERLGKDPYIAALTGGEDYELAFTVPAAKLPLFEKMMKVVGPTFNHSITKIGEVVDGEGVFAEDIHGREIKLAMSGFEHKF